MTTASSGYSSCAHDQARGSPRATAVAHPVLSRGFMKTLDADLLVTATGGLAVPPRPSTGPTFPRPTPMPLPGTGVPSPLVPRPRPFPDATPLPSSVV